MKTLLAVLLIASAPLRASAQEPIYRTEAYTLTPNGVTQGRFEATARSRTEIGSNYASEFDYSVQIKFAVNGTLRDIADYEENRLFFGSRFDRVVSPVYVFGVRESSYFVGSGSGTNRDGTTTVKFRLDMRPVLEAFKKRGYYEFYDKKRITPDEFKGVYITGNKPPLANELEGSALPPQFALTDPDGDGIYEVEVTLDTKAARDAAEAPARTWTLKTDVSRLPQYRSSRPLLDALYAMSLEEMTLDVRPDGTFMAGKLWDGVWTRDISHSIILSLAIVAPDVAKESLMRKVGDGHIIQDTGTGGSWPVSTDRMVWALAAWEVYVVTGDKRWLKSAYEIVRKSAAADLQVARASNGLFYGESDFMDWREQSYPRWMDPKDIYQSQSLSTNAVHYETYRVLAQMAQLAGQPGEEKEYAAVAASVREAINRHLWIPEKGYYGEYLYGRSFPSVSPRSESLGEALSILYGIPDSSRRDQIVRNAPVVEFGVPDFSPQIPNMPSYHNNAIWPFVVGYWTWAAAKARNGPAVEHGLAAIYRQAALFLTNKENMLATTGDTATMLNSDRQLWSVAANLATVYRVLFGMSFEPDRLVLRPFVPRAYDDTRTLTNFTYRAATLDITIKGFGDEIESVTLDDKRVASAVVPGDVVGHHTLVITMANNELPVSKITKTEVAFSPETPTVSLDGSTLRWAPVDGAQSYHVYENGRKVAAVSETAFPVPGERYGEYQVLAVDGRGLESFLSAPVEVVPPAAKIDVEAEAERNDALSQYDGYSGKGYIKLDKTQNLAVELRVDIREPGTYAIRFRYANGNGPVNTENKAAVRTLRLDGRTLGAIVMPQRGTQWNDWGYSNSHLVDLATGRHTIRVSFEDANNNMNGAVNEGLLDRVDLVLVKSRR